jgi:hypothetical protein
LLLFGRLGNIFEQKHPLVNPALRIMRDRDPSSANSVSVRATRSIDCAAQDLLCT